MRRILILTALILASVTTWADNYLYYIYSTGSKTAQVTNKDNFGNKVTYSGDIDIPDVVTLDGIEYKVTDILPSTFYNTSITSVKLGNNIKQIHGEAFRYCRNLTEITIPASVDSIGAWAFSDCGIKNVKIEDGEMPLKLWDWAGYCIFAGNPLETVYLGRNYISNGRPFRGFTTMKSVTVSDIVTAIQSEEFRGSKGIREVKLGENITEIGKSAFYDCDTLYSITLPESVLTLGEYAFYNCDTLTWINIPSQVSFIGGEAFRYCTYLDNISIPASVDSIGAWAFSSTGIRNIRIEDGEKPLKLWDWAGYCIFASAPLETVYLGRNYISNGRPFRGFTTMKSVTVSDIVTAIQSEEFRGSKGIREVKLGENITEIGKSAFYDCDTLYSITLPESVLTLGEYAFYNCDTLTWINIPSNVSFIGGEAFRYCTYLDNISIPASVDSIGAWAFSSTGIRNIRIEDGEKPLKLWDWAGYCIFASAPLETVYLGRNYISNGRPFRGFTTMKSVTVSDIVTAIQSEEFRGSKGIREVKLGENITEIGKSAFYDCDTLYSITLPESVLTLGEYAFYNCDTLTWINIPSQVSFIGGEAFRYCTYLDNISIPASVDSIGAWAFSSTGIRNIRIEDGEKPLKLWEWAGYCIFASAPLETVYLGRNYISNGRPFRGFTTMKSVTVSNIVTAIQSEEFRGSKGIREVKLGENITEIGKSAFYDCDTLYSITLPESVLTLGEYAFYNCDTLTWINIPSNVNLIGGEAFRYCRYLAEVTIPASVDSIGAWAFSSTGLKNVAISDGETPLKLWEWAGYSIFSGDALESLYLGRDYTCNAQPFREFQTMKALSIGSAITSLQSGAFEKCSGLEKIFCYNDIPPTCGQKVFSGVNKQLCYLYVPAMSIDLYKAAYTWNEFFNVGETSVMNLKACENAIDGMWFDLNGRPMESSKPGLNILRAKDGKAIKVFIP